MDVLSFAPKWQEEESSRKYISLALERQKSLFIMPRNDLSLGNSLEVLETLCAPEPRWVVSSQPTLRNPIPPLV